MGSIELKVIRKKTLKFKTLIKIQLLGVMKRDKNKLFDYLTSQKSITQI